MTTADFAHRFLANREGDYRIQAMRGTLVDALTTPVTLAGRPGRRHESGSRR